MGVSCQKKLRVLYIAHRLPYPPNKGDKIRSFNIVTHLARQHRVTLATLVDDAADIKWVPELTTKVEQMLYASIFQRFRRIFSARALLTGGAITNRFFYSESLQEQLDSLLDKEKFDVLMCSSSPMAEYLFKSRHFEAGFKGAKRIIDLIDVDSLKWAQYAEEAGPIRSWVYRSEAHSLADFERRIYEYFDYLLLVSEQEKKHFPREDTQKRIFAIANGVDLDYFNPSNSRLAGGGTPTLVFTGMMDYWPNIDGVLWFVKEVFDIIKSEFPDVNLLVVGGRPDRRILRLDKIAGITVTGFVEDIRKYTAQADVYIVPLRIARGIQNKILEAMAMGKAVVGTPQALEGIGATPGREVLVGESATEFADEVIGLLRHRDLAKKLGASARTFVERSHDWSMTLRELDKLIC